MSSDRSATVEGRLARLGFVDAERCAQLLQTEALRASGDALVESLADTADPDLALAGLVRLTEAMPDPSDLVDALIEDEQLRRRLLGVLGVSAALGDHLVRHPDDWRTLDGRDPLAPPADGVVRAEMLRAVGADPSVARPIASGAGVDALIALRSSYRRQLLALAARDVTNAVQVDHAAAELATLADAALEAGLAIARAELNPKAAPCRLSVIGMGKCGGRELNYVSDVDVVFVAEPTEGSDESAALQTATRLASGMMRACSASTPEGSLWEVDAALRPEGRSGPLVRTLASHLAYYGRWAKTWEFQALLKARHVAGDADLGAAYLDAVAPLVWQAADRPDFVDEVQAMRRRVENNVPRRDADRELKLGRGGLRDVEFAVQLLQLVHGRTDESLRSPNTLEALEALRIGGYVGRDDGERMGAAYRFLRSLEHRMQLHRLRRISIVPSGASDMRRLGRAMGFRTDPVGELTEAWRQESREVRRIHEKLFYRPLLQAVARLQGDEARLTPEAARQRLEALGYVDPAGALRHLEALTRGVSRRAAIQRTLLPVMLGWFADAADPDAGLAAFRRMSDDLGNTPWYLRMLRDEGAAAERLARVLSSSRMAADLLLRAPDGVTMLADDEELVPRARAALTTEIRAGIGRQPESVAAVATARAVRRRELFRIAVADLLGLISADRVAEALTDVAAATVTGALDVAVRQVEAELQHELPTRFSVIAMGRLGGHEMGYASDADVMFVHDPEPGADEKAANDAAHAVALELRRLLSLPAPDPPLTVDADLRPEGRQGPLVRTMASYEAYYARWSSVWETQALLRAEPLAGDEHLGRRFTWLIDPMRWSAAGIDDPAIREIRRIKARVEAERLPRGADPVMNTKLGPGGLSDVEWTVQLLQLRYAAQVEGLRTTGTLPALDAAAEAELVSRTDAAVLGTGWRLATRLRNAIMLVRGRSSDSLPKDVRELAAISRVVGYRPGEAGMMLDDWRRVTRRARAVVERVFYA